MERTVNIIRGGISYIGSVVTRRPIMLGYPLAAGIEVTNRCNLHCPQCPTGADILKVKKGLMTEDLFSRVNSEIAPYLKATMFYLRGEPFLHPELLNYIRRWNGKGIVVSTNGHFLTDENIDGIVNSPVRKLIISLDGLTQESYSAYRVGGDVGRVKEGIVRLMTKIQEQGKGPVVEVQCLANKFNEHELDGIRRFASSSGARFRLKTMQLTDPSMGDKWLPGDEHLSRYSKSGGGFKLKNRLPNRCLRLWTTPVITWNGQVLPCCFDKDESHSLGSLMEKSFSEIWFGREAREMRDSILRNRSGIGICRNCTSGLRKV